MRTLFAFLVIAVFLVRPGLAQANRMPATADKTRTRLEELFLWKVSDSLKLNTEEENRFNQSFRSLSEKRAVESTKMESLLKELETSQDSKKLSKTLEEYDHSLSRYNQIQIDELKQMRKIFGDKKFAQYLVLKRDLTQKLKNLLSSPSRPESGQPKEEVREPKVIEDN